MAAPPLLPAASPSDPGPGKGYTKVKEIGQGSYGKAVLVQDREGRMYVMKIIDMNRMDSKQRKDAINEVKVLSSLKHPYIVSYRESYTENRNLNIVMDYAEGGDLHQRITRTRHASKSFTEERVLRWFTEATLALKYLHDRHVLHRDLKSQNLFLTSQDRLRIGDFGISKVLESTSAFARTTIGTPYYLSPEICLEKPYSFSSDIWALGCILYEISVLRVPFDAQNLQALVQKITRGSTPMLPASFSAELRQLCGDLLHREQSARPNASDILHRPVIQQEIRRMLREEQAKGNASVSERASSKPTVEAEPEIVHRKASGGSDHVPRLSKLPSIGCSEDGAGTPDDSRISARHAGPPVLKGVGMSVCMDGVGSRNNAVVGLGAGVISPGRALYANPARDFDRGPTLVPAGVSSRQCTPTGFRRQSSGRY